VSVDAETGQTILHCMGELHAEILLYRITNDFRVPANIGEPRVAYREAIQAPRRREGGTRCGRGRRRSSAT